MAQRTTFKKKEMDKNEFIDSLYEIAQGNKTTYYGQTGWKAVEEILASDNRMTVQVKYDAILTKIKKEHNIIAKNIIPQLSELLHMAEFDDRRLVRKILHDFGSVWSRS